LPADRGGGIAKADYKYLEIFVRFREEEDKLLPPGTSFRLEANHLTPLLDRWWCARSSGGAPTSRAPSPIGTFRASTSISADDTIRGQGFRRQVRDQLKRRNPAQPACGSR